MALANISLDDKYALDTTRAYMTGIEALVRLPILQHQRDLQRGLNTAGFISGYRGSPVSGVDQALWKARPFLDTHNIKFTPGVNEDLAVTAVRGSQEVGFLPGARYDGVFSMWYGKGPGVDRSMDAIRHGNAAGSSKHGGVLIVAGDDHAAKSSTLPHQTEHMFVGASMPVLAPANVQEVLDLGIYGWELSRYSGCWVAMKAITENMDSAISADIDPRRVNIVIPEGFALPEDGVHVRWPDTPLEQETRLNQYKIYAAREFARANRLNRIVIDSDRPRLGIMASGKAYLDVLQALEDLGIDERRAGEIGLRVFKVGMVWPLDPVTTHQFADGVEEILVVEEKRSVVEDQLTGQLYNWPVNKRPRVIGEFDEQGRQLLTNCGELTPAMVARAIASRIQRFYDSPAMAERLKFLDDKERFLARREQSIQRKPHFCSGCPHNTSTQVPEGSVAYGGIGCHYMATQMPSRPTVGFTQMGGEGATWVGQAQFTDTPHVFQNLGDGTYFHSGLLAIRQCVAARVNITYKILYNDAVAMTGGQPVDGQLTVGQMIQQLRGEGVKRIALVSDSPTRHDLRERFEGYSLDHRDDLLAVEEELREFEGVSVLIYEQTCAAEKRRRRKRGSLVDPDRRVMINSAVCEGCGDCGQVSNCLSVVPLETELGRKRAINQDACNKDFSCVKGFCPSFVSVSGGTLRKPEGGSDLPGISLPEPTLPALDQPWNTVVAGVGGTGVLTVSSLVAMAAHIEGKGCATMNQTGLAQKFGAVVSHVRVAQRQQDIHAVRIPAGDADLLIGCDLVVAASDESLAKLNAARSHAVVNSAEAPTAEFVYNRDAEFPADEMHQAISASVRTQSAHFVDASDIADRLIGDALGANLFLLGQAYQRGLIPVSAAALEQAIELNGAAVEMNLRAFRWGRHAAHDATAAGPVVQTFAPLSSLEDVIEFRARHLSQWQDAAWAERYVQRVRQVEAAERHMLGVHLHDAELPLTAAVARGLFRVMSYKDEYEVGRLFSDGSFREELERTFEGDYKLSFHLAAPLLAGRDRHSGLPTKRSVGPWVLPLFSVLAKFKRLRGTWLDPFGYTAERRMERQLIDDYNRQIDAVLEHLSEDNHSNSVQLLGLIDEVRGYGHIKEAAVADWRRDSASLLAGLEGRIIELVVLDQAA